MAIVSKGRKSTRPPSVDAPDPLDQLIWYLGRAYYSYVGLLEQLLAESGLDRHLRPGMGHILFTLFAEDDLTIKQIAERSQLANSTLTGLLNRMETRSLLVRRRDDGDGRLIRVRLTSFGRSLEPKCRQLVTRLDAVFESQLGRPAIKRAKGLLRQMIAALRAASDTLESK